MVRAALAAAVESVRAAALAAALTAALGAAFVAAPFLSLTACASTPLQGDAAAAAAKNGDDKKADPKAKARDLELARLELRSAEFDAEVKQAAAREAVVKAERELQLARAALQAFETIDAPTQVDGAQISHDRQAYAADEARAELAELEAMYQAEEFAKATKELVLQRGRRRLEVAERELAVGKRKLAMLKDHALPRQQTELAGKVHDDEVALAKAKLEAEKAGIDGDVALRRARAKIEDLDKELAEATAKAAKAGS